MIYFVRHCQTNWNSIKKPQGRLDFGLNEIGKNQARELREKLSKIDFDKVFCSPLKRTRQTCKIITDKKIIFDNRLIERDYGEFAGLEKSEYDFDGFWNDNAPQDFKSAESIEDVKKRIYDFLNEIINKYKNKNILIVGHGGIGMIICGYFYGLPKDGNYRKYRTENGEIIIFNNKK